MVAQENQHTLPPIDKSLIMPEVKEPKPFDPNNISFCNFQKVFEHLEANRGEDGSIIFEDKLGTVTAWKQEGTLHTPIESSKVYHLKASEWRIQEGVNAAGTYRRCVINVGGTCRIVSIVNGKPTVDEKWMDAPPF